VVLPARQSSYALAVITLLGASAVAPHPALAQATGAIAGNITAAPTAQPLPGTTITLVGTRYGAIADEHGAYRITDLPAGQYLARATRIDRQAQQHRIIIRAGETIHLDFALAERSLLLPGVVVSAARAPLPSAHIAATVNALSAEAVRASPARAADDLLREAPGVQLPRISSTVSGPEQIVSLRGVDEGSTLVLFNGVPLNDPWGEWIQWNRVPTFSVDHVEVLQGGGSSLYGNYAMGGVIQLFSRPITPRTVRALATGGSRGLYDASLFASDLRGPLGLALSADIGGGGGYIVVPPSERGTIDIPSTATRRNLNLRAEYALGANRTLSASANVFDDDRSGGTPLSPDSRTIGSVVLGGDFGTLASGQLTTRLFGSVQRYASHQSRTAPDRSSESPALFQRIPSHDVGGSAQWSRAIGPFQLLSAGGDFHYATGHLEENVFDTTGATTATRTTGGSQLIGGVFVQGVLAPAARWRIEASARLDGWRNFAGSRTVSDSGARTFAARSDGALSPRVGVSYAALPTLTLRASGYQAFRAPTLNEQYRDFLSGNLLFQANPELGPEHLTGGDVGLDWRPSSMVELTLTGFVNRLRDLGTFVPVAPGILRRENVGRTRSRGAEAVLAVHPTHALRIVASYDYDDARITAAPNPASVGTRVPRVPLQRATLRAIYSAPAVGELSVMARYEGAETALSGASLAPFVVVDLQARRTLVREVALYLAVENVTDREYLVDRAGNSQSTGLPRTVRAGLSVQ
jgi:outer membrane receptor protein involved in Fe transport